MSLDIDKLRLTFKEAADAVEGDAMTVADAQLAKALWGIVDWLKGWQYVSGGPGPLYGAGWMAAIGGVTKDLEAALKAASMERPLT